MRFVVAGSSGFLGTHLVAALADAGHQVTRLVRAGTGPGNCLWDPYAGQLDPKVIETADIVVNLAGSPTAGNPHSTRWAHDLENSRVTTTRVLAEAIAASDRKPAFLAGNGISYYGDHGAEVLTETSDSRGEALLTRVTKVWQQATTPASEAGARVVVIRTAPVLDAASAPLKQQLLLFKLGLGGPLGDGRQYFPVIGLRDWIDALIWCADHDLVGPVNFCIPRVPTNAEFTEALAKKVRRPAFFKVPGFVIDKAAGEMAPEVLGSLRTKPQALLDSGYQFSAHTITELLDQAI